MAYAPVDNNTIGIVGLLTYLNTSLGAVNGDLGANMISLFLMIPLWLIVFLPLSRINPLAAFTTTNFIMVIFSYLLMTMGIASTITFGLFGALTAIGAVAFFLRVGQ
jgi:hypothetical protein